MSFNKTLKKLDLRNMAHQIRNKIHSIAGFFRFSIRKALTPYLHVFGYEFLTGPTPKETGIAGFSEMLRIIKKCSGHKHLIDIGMGDGRLYKWIQESCLDITYEGLDYGNSNDYAALKLPLTTYKQLFLEFKPIKKYDIIFMSHFLEHQNNIGATLNKIAELIQINGIAIFEWPLPHRRLIGGHVAMLTPALLAYNLAKIGFDLSKSRGVRHGTYATLIFVYKGFSPMSELKHDTGELLQLSDCLPPVIFEGSDSYIEWDTLEISHLSNAG